LDADPSSVAEVLGPLAAARPGLRVPGAADGWEVAVRAVLGQQITVVAARTLAARLTERCGRFPRPEDLASLPDEAFPMPRTRIATLRALAEAAPRLESPADAHALVELPGIGPWTAGYVALRLGDPDVFLPTDAGVLRALGTGAREAARRAEAWRPWRSYAVAHLWASL
ncbi:MAG: DNA-3-methyladenine glycosylase 2 family protein, partial [Solirubrobacterales bacterium]|nr:DNA-3-methyladenine glycosylase 2 family protein [Solirubrobacterales bacterium]